MIQNLESEYFYCEHLFDTFDNEFLIQDFTVKNPSGNGLVYFLQKLASIKEESNEIRTYLVKSKITNEIAGYFSFKNGLFTLEDWDKNIFTVPAIELSNFAVNETYRKKHHNAKRIGEHIFYQFILPIVKQIQTLTGVQALYIYALPEERLMEHYETFGFTQLPEKDEQFVHGRVKPAYDEGCIFMYQII